MIRQGQMKAALKPIHTIGDQFAARIMRKNRAMETYDREARLVIKAENGLPGELLLQLIMDLLSGIRRMNGSGASLSMYQTIRQELRHYSSAVLQTGNRAVDGTLTASLQMLLKENNLRDTAFVERALAAATVSLEKLRAEAKKKLRGQG